MAGFSDISDEFQREFDALTTRLFFGGQVLKNDMQERIFDNGENSSGSKVQSVKAYSTKEAYFSQDSLPRQIKTQGKRGTPIKSAYFPQGYSEMKKAVGRPPLELRNTLKSAFINTAVVDNSGEVSLILTGFGGQIEGLDKLYNDVFTPSELEVDKYADFMLNGEI